VGVTPITADRSSHHARPLDQRRSRSHARRRRRGADMARSGGLVIRGEVLTAKNVASDGHAVSRSIPRLCAPEGRRCEPNANIAEIRRRKEGEGWLSAEVIAFESLLSTFDCLPCLSIVYSEVGMSLESHTSFYIGQGKSLDSLRRCTYHVQ
jgi:hypothetical protein